VASELHVLALINLDLGEPDRALQLLEHAVEMRRQLMAGRAPVGPEVDEDRPPVGGLDDRCSNPSWWTSKQSPQGG
jgi:hypothetical protein